MLLFLLFPCSRFCSCFVSVSVFVPFSFYFFFFLFSHFFPIFQREPSEAKIERKKDRIKIRSQSMGLETKPPFFTSPPPTFFFVCVCAKGDVWPPSGLQQDRDLSPWTKPTNEGTRYTLDYLSFSLSLSLSLSLSHTNTNNTHTQT